MDAAPTWRCIQQALEEPAPKRFFHGTHRTATPTETLARFGPLAPAMGITRISDVTGLDRIGIPVAMAVRPNSRSVSVCQGKGPTVEHAFASALMEAAEQFHGEGIAHLFHLASYRQLSARAAVVDPWKLAGNGKPFDPDKQIHWIEGYDLLGREPCWVPAEIVHTDFTTEPRPDSGVFQRGTNGLASGNHLLEALSAGICEVVERDAVARWNSRPLLERVSRALDLDSVNDAACRWLLDRFAAAGVGVRVWDVTSHIGLAAFVCDIREESNDPALGMRRFRGAGCHPDRAVALSRALTEAAQTRLTYIVGARDDLSDVDYNPKQHLTIAELLVDESNLPSRGLRLQDTQNYESADFRHDLEWSAQHLLGSGVMQLVAVNLRRSYSTLHVLRVIVPSLKGDYRNQESE